MSAAAVFAPTPGHALDVVDAVAHESEKIREAFGRHAESVFDLVVAIAHVVGVVPVHIPGANQLRVILVARDQRGAQAFAAAAGHQCADDVIRLVLGMAEGRNAGMAAELAATLELQLEIRGRRIAIRLVGRIDLVAKRGREALVERNGDVARLGALDEVAEKSREAESGVRGIAVAVDHVGRHGVIGAEYVDRRVDEINHARMVNGVRPRFLGNGA